jgi:lipopolysaccharide export system protein LptA
MEGGATLDSSSDDRQVHGAAPTADLAFTAQGLLHHAHLEKGVVIHSDETSAAGEPNGELMKVSRDWRSPVADLDFREASKGQVELASVTGTGGVLITGQTQRGSGPVTPSRMAADQVTAAFGDGQVLSTAVGTGHASLVQTTSSGAKQTTSGDRIEASFAPPSARVSKNGTQGRAGSAPTAGSPAAAQIQSATVDGNVVLVQEPVIKPGAEPPATLRATAGRAAYEGSGEWLHLTVNPRVEDGGLQLTADRLDVSQGSGDAFAHGNVKATWFGRPAGKSGPQSMRVSGQGISTFGGQGPAHVIAAEAQLHQATGEATFRGQARLWQQANSITAPVIVLDRTRQTLVAKSTNAAEPVRVVMLSAGGTGVGKSGQSGSPTLSAENAERMGHGASVGNAAIAGKGTTMGAGTSVIRVRGGDLKYSEAERKAVMHGGGAGSVVAETGSATSTSDELELMLLPPGNHAGKDGGPAQVDSMTKSGHVVVSSQGRRGTGDRLVYSNETDEYVLTGSASNPPRMTDPARGTVAGVSLIFNSSDDSVSIEGGGRKTLTETIAPK